jgi:hypothetical protein
MINLPIHPRPNIFATRMSLNMFCPKPTSVKQRHDLIERLLHIGMRFLSNEKPKRLNALEVVRVHEEPVEIVEIDQGRFDAVVDCVHLGSRYQWMVFNLPPPFDAATRTLPAPRHLSKLLQWPDRSICV